MPRTGGRRNPTTKGNGDCRAFEVRLERYRWATFPRRRHIARPFAGSQHRLRPQTRTRRLIGWRFYSAATSRRSAPSPLLFELILSILAGWQQALRNRPLEKRRLAERRAEQVRFEGEIKAKAHADGIACPLCGFPLRVRRSSRGKNKGVGYFMGCTRYPHCKGSRDLTPDEASRIPKRRSRNTS